MPNVSDVHHMFYAEVVEEKRALEKVFKDIAAQVADVGVIVDGMPKILVKDFVWPASIYAHMVSF